MQVSHFARFYPCQKAEGAQDILLCSWHQLAWTLVCAWEAWWCAGCTVLRLLEGWQECLFLGVLFLLPCSDCSSSANWRKFCPWLGNRSRSWKRLVRAFSLFPWEQICPLHFPLLQLSFFLKSVNRAFCLVVIKRNPAFFLMHFLQQKILYDWFTQFSVYCTPWHLVGNPYLTDSS